MLQMPRRRRLSFSSSSGEAVISRPSEGPLLLTPEQYTKRICAYGAQSMDSGPVSILCAKVLLQYDITRAKYLSAYSKFMSRSFGGLEVSDGCSWRPNKRTQV